MTIVAIIEDNKGNIYMGSDGLTNQNKSYISNTNAKKIICLDEKCNFWVGCAGNMAYNYMIEIFYRKKISKKYNQVTLTPLEYLFEIFVPELRNFLRTNDYTFKDNELTKMFQSNFLIYLDGKKFLLNEDFEILLINKPFEAIGSGDAYATGAWNALQIILDVKDYKIKGLLYCIIEATCNCVVTCGGEISIEKCNQDKK